MRNWIKAVNESFEHWPEDILADLEDHQSYACHAAVHGDDRHPWQQRLITYMGKRAPHVYDGMLYRGTVCDDHVAKSLREGKPVVHSKVGSLVESWAKTRAHALQYFGDADNSSYVLIAINARDLKIVCDIDQVPFDSQEPGEVLVLAEDRMLNEQNVLEVIWCDYRDNDNHGNHYSAAPNLAQTALRESHKPWLDHTDEEVTWQGWWKPEYGIDNFIRGEFSQGYCGYLARALHEKTNWPVYAELEYGNSADSFYIRGGSLEHVWCVNHQGYAVDINGVHPEEFAQLKFNDPDWQRNIDEPHFMIGKRGAMTEIRSDSLEVLFPEDDYGMLDLARKLVALFPKHFGIQ